MQKPQVGWRSQRAKLDEAVAISLRRRRRTLSIEPTISSVAGTFSPHMGELFRRQGKYQRAVEYFERAIAL